MKKKTTIRLAIAAAALVLTTVGGWIARQQVERYAANKLLFDMVVYNQVEGVAWAVEMGADASVRNKDTQTPLHLAAWEGRDQCLRILLEAGADVNSRDSFNRSPLHLAAANGQVQCVQDLLKFEAHTEAKALDGATPLHYAVEHGRVGCVRVLTERGADLNAVDGSGNTPLHLWARSGEGPADVFELLIRSGSRTETKDPDGYTPLWYPVMTHLEERSSMLLKAGADPNVADQDGHTPLDWAKGETMKALLRKYGAKTGNELKQELTKSPDKKLKETEGTAPASAAE